MIMDFEYLGIDRKGNILLGLLQESKRRSLTVYLARVTKYGIEIFDVYNKLKCVRIEGKILVTKQDNIVSFYDIQEKVELRVVNVKDEMVVATSMRLTDDFLSKISEDSVVLEVDGNIVLRKAEEKILSHVYEKDFFIYMADGKFKLYERIRGTNYAIAMDSSGVGTMEKDNILLFGEDFMRFVKFSISDIETMPSGYGCTLKIINVIDTIGEVDLDKVLDIVGVNIIEQLRLLYPEAVIKDMEISKWSESTIEVKLYG